MQREDRPVINRLFNAARPKALKGEELDNHLNELMTACEAFDFDKLLRQAQGSRIFQLLFRRGNKDLRARLFQLIAPEGDNSRLFSIATTKYSNHLFTTFVKRGSNADIEFLVQTLKGTYVKMFKHNIGIRTLSVLYERMNKEQKKLMFMDFYGPEWAKLKTAQDFEEICKQEQESKARDPKKKTTAHQKPVWAKKEEEQQTSGQCELPAVQYLKQVIEHACDKNGAEYRITHDLINMLVSVWPECLGSFVTYMKELAFTPSGSELAIKCVQVARQSHIVNALRLLEGKPLKEVIPSVQAPSAGGDNNEDSEFVEEEEEEEEEEAAEMGEVVEQSEEVVPVSTVTGQMAADRWAWRVLSCAISHLDSFEVIADEVMPKLMSDWDALKTSCNALRVFVRMITTAPSVFSGIKFQKDGPIPDELKDIALPEITAKILDEMGSEEGRDIMASTPDGSRLVAAVMKAIESVADMEEAFEELSGYVFMRENILHKVNHKMVKTALQSDIKNAKKLAKEAIGEGEDLLEVLNSPGAWVVAELAKNDTALRKKAEALIKKHKIEGKAIIAITNPRDSSELMRKGRVPEKRRRKNQEGAPAREEPPKEEPAPAPETEEPKAARRRRKK